jgi:hypothetical protein
MPQGLPFHLKDYVELVEWTGCIIRSDKLGHIAHSSPPILGRLAIPDDTWLKLTQEFESQFKTLVGAPETLKAAATTLGFTRRPGLSRCKAAFT